MTLDDLRAKAHALNLKLSEAANLADELAVALQNYQPGPVSRPDRAELTMTVKRYGPVQHPDNDDHVRPKVVGVVIGPSRVTTSGDIFLGLEAPMVVSNRDQEHIARAYQQYEQVLRARMQH